MLTINREHAAARPREAIQRKCSTSPKTPPRRSSPSTPSTATSTRWPSRGATEVRVQPRRRRPAPAGSTFKAIVPRRRALPRHRPLHHLLPLAHARGGLAARATPPTSDDRRRRHLERAAQPRHGARRLRQHRLRAARRRPRRDLRHPHGYAIGVPPGTCTAIAAEALGGLTLGVTPLEMANVYATLADGGWRNKQITITKVVFPDGHVDRELGRAAPDEGALHAADRPSRPRSSSTTSSTARRPARRSTAHRGQDGHHQRPRRRLAGRLHPDRATVVWMGYPKANISMTDVHGEPQFGGLLPAEIWHDFMSSVVHRRARRFPTPTPTR